MSRTDETETPRIADAGRMLPAGAPRGRPLAAARTAAGWVAAVVLPLAVGWIDLRTDDPAVTLLGVLAMLAASLLGGLGPGLLATVLVAADALKSATMPDSLAAVDTALVLRVALDLVLGASIAAMASRIATLRSAGAELLVYLARERAEGRRRDAELQRLTEEMEERRQHADGLAHDLQLARERARPVHVLGPGAPAAPRVRHAIAAPLHLFPPTTSDWLG